MQAIVDAYKNANLNIQQNCKAISELLLVKIDGKKVYENLEFDEDQQHHRKSIQQRLSHLHEEIIRIMRQTYEVFRTDGQEVIRNLYFFNCG